MTSSASRRLAKLRNIGIIAHIDAGKTTLTERFLFYSHKIHRMGEVHEGTATMDFMPEEQERGITISSACTTSHWNDHTINLIDTPGHVDFTIEVERSLRVLDGAVGVFCAVGGVEPQSETVWRQSERFLAPKLAFVNKMDRLGADYAAVLRAIADRLGATPLPVTVPWGEGADLAGVIDVVTMERLGFDPQTKGESVSRSPLTTEEAEYAAPWRERMLETLADADDAFMETYLSGADLAAETLRPVIRNATLARRVVPAFAGSALKNVGVQPLFDGVCDFLPSPLEAALPKGHDPATGALVTLDPSPKASLAALAFKVSMVTGRRHVYLRLYSGQLHPGDAVLNVTQQQTERAARLFRMHADHREKLDTAAAGDIVVAAGMKHARTGDSLAAAERPVVLESIERYQPVISIAVEPRSQAEADKLDEVLEKCLVEDPTLALVHDEETGQRVLSGMGELHLEVVLDRLRREYGVEPRHGKPQVIYQETVQSAAEAEGVFHRALGEVMHHGQVTVRLEPRERGAGNEIRMEVDPTGYPESWLDAARDGVELGLQSGPRGYPVTDVRATVKALARREGESSPAGFHMAAQAAVREAFAQGGAALLEPLMRVEITVPEDHVGDAVSLLGSIGAKVEAITDLTGGAGKAVSARAALRSLFGFSTELRSATQGRAGLVIAFAHFDVLDG